MVSCVQDYHDIWMFLNVSREVFKRQDDIPKRHHGDPTGREDYEWFCEEVIHETISDKLQHYASPVEAHRQMYIFTHWFDLVRLVKRIQEYNGGMSLRMS